MHNHKPNLPKLPTRFLQWFLREDLAEEVLGDLEEKFYDTADKKSLRAARLNYWYQVFNYVRPFAISRRTRQQNHFAMYGNYFKTSLRTSLRGKLHSSINLLGLTTGMVVAMLLSLWLWDEVSYDTYHKNHGRIAAVIQNVTNNGEIQTWWNVPLPLAEEIRRNYGEDFEEVVMGTNQWEHAMAIGEKKLYKVGIFFEQGAPELLSLQIINGTSDMSDPSNILLSESTAIALFGDQDPIGKSMIVDDVMEAKVGGVYEDIPYNSTFSSLEFVGSWQLYYDNNAWMRNMEDPWRPNAFRLYVALKDYASFEDVSNKIRDAKMKNLSEALALKKPELFLHPMSRWHLYSEFESGINTGGRIRYVWLFGIIAVFVLAMACINFMNLSTAQSERRSKEIGIRKTVGSARGQLMSQFFVESFLMAAISFLVALLIVYLLLPQFNVMADKKLELLWREPLFLAACFGFIVATGLLAGSYPAMYLSSIKSIQALKGTFKPGRAASLPRRVLVVLQFCVSICLITGTLIVFQQIEYARDRHTGYDGDGLISIPINSNEVYNHFEAVKQELFTENVITKVAMTEAPVTSSGSSTSGFSWRGKDPDLSVDFLNTGVTHEFGETVDWEIVAGRDFSRDFPSDSSAVILNESAIRYMGLKEPVGEIVQWFDTDYRVIGIVHDLIVESPYEPVRPHIYFLSQSSNFFVLRTNPALGTRAALDKIKATFTKYNPGETFDFSFVSEDYAKKFGSEERVGNLAGIFSVLAIFICSLGIFGLSSFMAERRTKEIGIRKVSGASVFALWRLLSKDFVVLVIISGIVSVPISYFVISGWLENYSYHTVPAWWVYLVSIVGTLIITLITVSYHTIHAARINPVKCLRVE